MCCIHAVFVCPQRGIGVFASGKSVNSSVVNGQGIGGVVIITDFNSRFTGSAAIAVIEGAVVYDKIGGIGRSRSAVEQDCLAVGVEGASLERHIRAAPGPDGVLVGHGVVKDAVDEGGLAEQGQLALDGAVLKGQFVADNTIKVAFASLNGEVFECERRATLIVQLSALCADSICNNIYSLAVLTAVSLDEKGAA